MTKKWMTAALSALAVVTLAACSNNQSNQTAASTSASSSSMTSSSASSSSSSMANSQAASNQLDGTYTAKHEGEDLTLTITGMTGQLTTLELNGEQEIEPVQVNEADMTLTIGDDVKPYELKGNQLIINDFDRELDDQVTFTKK